MKHQFPSRQLFGLMLHPMITLIEEKSWQRKIWFKWTACIHKISPIFENSNSTDFSCTKIHKFTTSWIDLQFLSEKVDFVWAWESKFCQLDYFQWFSPSSKVLNFKNEDISRLVLECCTKIGSNRTNIQGHCRWILTTNMNKSWAKMWFDYLK